MEVVLETDNTQQIKDEGKVKKILYHVPDVGTKVFVILLFALVFMGVINPARISDKITNDVSLVKSAFYFKDLVSGFTAQEEEVSEDEVENPFAALLDETGESGDYDDMYSMMQQMIDESAASTAEDETLLEEDDSDDITAEAEPIEIIDFGPIWDQFKEENPDTASALNRDRVASILTFFAIIICIVGLLISCGTNKIKRLGNIIVCAGAVLVCLSLINFYGAYNALLNSTDAIDVMASSPKGVPFYIVFSVLSLACACVSIFVYKAEKTEASELKPEPFRIVYRLLAILLFVLLFLPAANPARISSEISRNVSLFTSGFFYNILTENLQRTFIRGWLPESVMRIAWVSSLFACLGIFACAAGTCMSVGNNKLKRIGHICLLAGSAVSLVSLVGIMHSYNLISSSPNIDRVSPMEPHGVALFAVLLVVIFAVSLVSLILTPAPEKGEKCHIDAPLQLFLMLSPFLVLVLVFSYLPLWGWRYAFFDYEAGQSLSLDNWVGLKWFRLPFENAATRNDIIRVLRNTLAMSFIGLLTSWLPMFFAIFLVEIKNTKVRSVVQTLTTVPNFISWVIVYAIAFCIFGTEGFFNNFMSLFDKAWVHTNYLNNDNLIWIKMWLWGTWKGLGWSAILYIAAISGIDQELYEAATVDGAGRFQKMWHITVPELLPTFLVLFVMSVSNILSNGMDQYLVFKNPSNSDPIEVLDLYVYTLTFGATSSNIPFSTVVSMFKSVISVLLLVITNRVSKAIRGSSIF